MFRKAKSWETGEAETRSNPARKLQILRIAVRSMDLMTLVAAKESAQDIYKKLSYDFRSYINRNYQGLCVCQEFLYKLSDTA